MHLARRAGVDHQAGAGAQPGLHQVMVHLGTRDQRGDRDALRGHRAIRQDQHVVTVGHGLVGCGAQGLHRLRATRRTLCRRIGDIQHQRAIASLRELVDVAQLRDVVVRQHRLVHFQAQRRIGFLDAEQVGFRADERSQRHHDLFADRIDRRVGHLREQLLEVIVERAVLVRQHRQRGIGAHRAGRLLAGADHRRQDEFQVFLRITERLLGIQQRCIQVRLGRHFGQVAEEVAGFLDPLAVWLGGGELMFQFGIIDDAPGLHVDQEHLARLQPPFLDDLVLRDIQHAHLGSHQHHVVVGDQVARRTQAVAVQRRAYHAAIGERHGGGAVPRLHQRGMVFVERAALLVHQRIAGPGFGYQQHHRVRQRITARHQQSPAHCRNRPSRTGLR